MTEAICAYEDLLPGRGVCALVGDEHVAIFRLEDGSVHAVSNIDPFTGASVLSRGLVGTVQSEVGDADWVPYVASPLRKQRFDLRTGICIDDAEVTIACHAVDLVDGLVMIGSSESLVGLAA